MGWKRPAILGLLVALLSAWSGTAAQPAAPRLVAIGDIHGDMPQFRRALQIAGATNARDEWIGGRLTIVQLGDLIGRSDDERQVLDYLFELQRKATAAGGAVHALVGNHEVFGGRVDNQAVGPNPFPLGDRP